MNHKIYVSEGKSGMRQIRKDVITEMISELGLERQVEYEYSKRERLFQ